MEVTDEKQWKNSGWKNILPHQFKKGQSGNPAGRPKGKSLKEYTREMLASMTEDERQEFLTGLPKDIIWRMSEGNPETGIEHSGGVEFTIKVEHDHRALEAPSESKPDNPEPISV